MSGDDLDRFVTAQQQVYRRALAELRAGAKRSHWMWFVFPQIAGLGLSAMSQLYAIRDGAEARAFLAHPVLGARLRECTAAVLAHEGKSAEAIFGGIDAIKLKSSMTLFEAIGLEPVGEADDRFARCVDVFFAGVRDATTLRLLAVSAASSRNPRRAHS